MEGIKFYFNKLKEIWKIPRWNALIKLSIYIIFFFFVIASLRTSVSNDRKTYTEDNPSSIKNTLDIYKERTKFNSFVKFDGTEYKYTYGDFRIVTLNNKSYTVKNGMLEYYFEEDRIEDIEGVNIPKVPFRFWVYTPKYVSELLENAKLVKKTSIFEDIEETIESIYEVSLTSFILKYDDTFSLENTEGKNITITLTEKNKEVISVLIDLTTFSSYIDLKEDTLFMEIKYY